jgi:hypothetical protein
MYKEFVDAEGNTRTICYEDGWNHLVQPLLEELEQLGGKVLQVKEKFGGLRFYYHLDENHPQAGSFAEKVAIAEDQAVAICEVCGQPGERRSGGWIKTLCDVHEQDQQLRIKRRADEQ